MFVTRLVIEKVPAPCPYPNIAFLDGIPDSVVILLLAELGLLVPTLLVAVTVNV